MLLVLFFLLFSQINGILEANQIITKSNQTGYHVNHTYQLVRQNNSIAKLNSQKNESFLFDYLKNNKINVGNHVNGTIENGNHANGTIENGYHANGTIENGNHANGTNENGNHANSTIENGNHANGTTENGNHAKASFENGNHAKASFENGNHANATIETGNYNSIKQQKPVIRFFVGILIIFGVFTFCIFLYFIIKRKKRKNSPMIWTDQSAKSSFNVAASIRKSDFGISRIFLQKSFMTSPYIRVRAESDSESDYVY